MDKQELRRALISLAVGAVMAFLSSFFGTLAEFFKAHSTEIVGGVVAGATYLFKNARV